MPHAHCQLQGTQNTSGLTLLPMFFLPWLLLLTSAATGQSERSASGTSDQDNIIVVLDASGSMRKQMNKVNKTRMEAAKEALAAVMQDVPATTNVGLLVFSSSNLKNDWAYPLKPVDQSELIKAIQAPQPGGGTPLGAYLKKGTDALLKQRAAQHGFGTYRLLVVTDGQANDQRLVDTYLPDVLSRGITVDVIGVDMAQDLSLATQVHSYRRADDPETLVEAVKNVFAEVGSSSQDHAAREADFAIIAPIPDQMAGAIVTALANVSDHPIGETPPAAAGSATSSPASPPQYDPFQPGLPPAPAGHETRFFPGLLSILGNLCFFGFIFLIIAGFILVQMGKAAQRRSRR